MNSEELLPWVMLEHCTNKVGRVEAALSLGALSPFVLRAGPVLFLATLFESLLSLLFPFLGSCSFCVV